MSKHVPDTADVNSGLSTDREASRRDHLPYEIRHLDEVEWETIRWPGETGKMLFHPRPERPTEPNAGVLRLDILRHADAGRDQNRIGSVLLGQRIVARYQPQLGLVAHGLLDRVSLIDHAEQCLIGHAGLPGPVAPDVGRWIGTPIPQERIASVAVRSAILPVLAPILAILDFICGVLRVQSGVSILESGLLGLLLLSVGMPVIRAAGGTAGQSRNRDE